jgi:MtN3 and saliva related transmembrane protein
VSPTIIGLVAGIFTTLAVIPQVVKTLKTRHVRDLSIWQPLLLTIGVALWTIYGILIHDLPLIIANLTSLICNALLTGMKIHYGSMYRSKADSHFTYSEEETT